MDTGRPRRWHRLLAPLLLLALLLPPAPPAARAAVATPAAEAAAAEGDRADAVEAAAPAGRRFSALLGGKGRQAGAIVGFELSADGARLAYRVYVANVRDAVAVEILLGRPRTGPRAAPDDVVAALYRAAPGRGLKHGLLARGTLTAAQLEGSLRGRPLAQLVARFERRQARVRIRTDDGRGPPRPRPPVRASEELEVRAGEVLDASVNPLARGIAFPWEVPPMLVLVNGTQVREGTGGPTLARLGVQIHNFSLVPVLGSPMLLVRTGPGTTATPGDDFRPIPPLHTACPGHTFPGSATCIIPPGVHPSVMPAEIVGDATAEPDEKIVLDIRAAFPWARVVSPSASVTIEDDDCPADGQAVGASLVCRPPPPAKERRWHSGTITRSQTFRDSGSEPYRRWEITHTKQEKWVILPPGDTRSPRTRWTVNERRVEVTTVYGRDGSSCTSRETVTASGTALEENRILVIIYPSGQWHIGLEGIVTGRFVTGTIVAEDSCGEDGTAPWRALETPLNLGGRVSPNTGLLSGTRGETLPPGETKVVHTWNLRRD